MEEKDHTYPGINNLNPRAVIKEIGLALKYQRKKLGYSSPDKFAYEKGIDRSQYGKYEAGTEDMRLSSLIKVLDKMGLTLEQFFKEMKKE
jgi:transcriptional regulator with XRE-family HTH domain